MFEGLSADEWSALHLSLKVSLWAVACALPLGILVAWLLARGRFPAGAPSRRTGAPAPDPTAGRHRLPAPRHLRRRAPVGAFLADHLGLVFSFRWTAPPSPPA